MAPSNKQPEQTYKKDERVFCFHGELMYEAKILDYKFDPEEGPQYNVHYKGWKSRWDSWVSEDRVRKATEDNKVLAANLRASVTQGSKPGKKGGKPQGSELGSTRGSEERGGASTYGGRGAKRGRDYDLENEEHFYAKPSVKFVIPDHIKGLLVDDWENVTKNNQLVPLPHPHPVKQVLDDYVAYEKSNRREESSSMDILEETVSGLFEYFNKSLGRILLYRFERSQYSEFHDKWASSDPEWAGKGPSDTYGAEHLCRLLVSLPELVAQTNMDQQSVNRLREELAKLAGWLSKNAAQYFVAEYETPGHEYVDKAKGS